MTGVWWCQYRSSSIVNALYVWLNHREISIELPNSYVDHKTRTKHFYVSKTNIRKLNCNHYSVALFAKGKNRLRQITKDVPFLQRFFSVGSNSPFKNQILHAIYESTLLTKNILSHKPTTRTFFQSFCHILLLCWMHELGSSCTRCKNVFSHFFLPPAVDQWIYIRV